MNTNLPLNTQNSNKEVKQFFNNYFTEEVTFPSNQIDAVIGFFESRGFDIQASRSVSIVLLNQSRIDNINVFELLDKLKNYNNVQLTQIITQVLNFYRTKTSVLGYKITSTSDAFENRNILE
jgi:hypothetical protein